MNSKKATIIAIIILIIFACYTIMFNNILSRKENETDIPNKVYKYYIHMFPELKESINENRIQNINIEKQIGVTDILISIDKILYDVENDKILLMYHFKNLKEKDKVKLVKGTIKDLKNNSWTRTVAMRKLTKLDEGIRLNDEFYGILAFESLKDINGTKYQPNKCSLELNIRINSNRYQLYNIFLNLQE